MRGRKRAAGEAGVGFEASYQAVCARGFLFDPASAGCLPCHPGAYNNVANAAECLPCATGFYAPVFASTACVQCPSFSTTPTQGSFQLESCICQPGYFGPACDICPEGGDEELDALIKATIAHGGVVPHIHKELEMKKGKTRKPDVAPGAQIGRAHV